MDTTDAASVITISIGELSLGELQTEYYTIKNLLTTVQTELDQKNQELHDCKRLLKTAEALEKDYQQEIEALQNNDHEEQLKLKSTVQKLEANLAESKQFYCEQIHCLEGELSVKNDKIKDLQDELKSASENVVKQTVTDEIYEALKDEYRNLKVEFETLQASSEELFEEHEALKSRNFVLEEESVMLKDEIENLKENLQTKREEIAEANEMINTLQGEIAGLRNEMETLRKPLDTDSKGNSLFAEVDDRRVELQKTIKNMRTKYTEMKKEYSNLMRQLASLRAENVKLKECWEADLSEVDSDDQNMLNSFKSRIEALEVIIKSYQDELNEMNEKQKNDNGDTKSDFRFFDIALQKKRKEIESLRQEMNSQSIRTVLLTDELKAANAQMRKLKLEKIGLEQELEKYKTDIQLNNAENVLTKLMNSECDENKLLNTTEIDDVPIKQCSQNVDFSRLEIRKKSRSLNMNGVASNVFDTENKENVTNVGEIQIEECTASSGGEGEGVQTKKVMFVDGADVKQCEVKAPMRRGTKIIKSNPLVFTSYKK